MASIKRHVHFYRIIIGSDQIRGNDAIRQCFSYLIDLNKTHDPSRFHSTLNGTFCSRDLSFDGKHKRINGRLLVVRSDVFPEIIDMNNDQLRDIEASDSEGIVESTHFVINYAKSDPVIAIEYNHFGPRSSEFTRFLEAQFIGIGQPISIALAALVNDNLQSVLKRMNRISSFYVRVHRDNIGSIKALDKQLGSALQYAMGIGHPEYAEVRIKYDYRRVTGKGPINQVVAKTIGKFKKDASFMENFDLYQVEAEDAKRHDTLSLFDLLSDKIKDEVRIEKRHGKKSLVTADAFIKLNAALDKL